MTLLKKKPKIEANQDIVNDYIDDGQPWPAERRTIAAWAIRKRRWQPSQKEMIDRCAQELAEAMRAEMEMDPQGRTVRAKHCALITERDEAGNKVQKRLWFDRSSSTPELMRLALQQRRRKVLGECKQLRKDLDSYNDNNTVGACSCCASTNKNTWPRLVCVSAGVMELLVLGHHRDDPNELWGFVVVASDVLSKTFKNDKAIKTAFPSVELVRRDYRDAGQHQLSLHAHDEESMKALLQHSAVQEAAAALALRVMRKRATIYSKFHCKQLADSVLV